jgi:hypothetical protein
LLGGVAESIHRVADEVDADLVVMSTHALTGAARVFLGSMADTVVRTAARPVLVVHRDSQAHGDDYDIPPSEIELPELVAATVGPAPEARPALGFDPSA